MSTNFYNWISSLIGAPTQGSNSTYVTIAGFLLVMIFIVSLDFLLNGIFRLFRRNK